MSIVETLLNSLQADAPVRQVLVGAFWTAVVLDTDPPRCGLASTLRGETHEAGPPVTQAGHLLERSGRDLAELLRSSSTLEGCLPKIYAVCPPTTRNDFGMKLAL